MASQSHSDSVLSNAYLNTSLSVSVLLAVYSVIRKYFLNCYMSVQYLKGKKDLTTDHACIITKLQKRLSFDDNSENSISPFSIKYRFYPTVEMPVQVRTVEGPCLVVWCIKLYPTAKETRKLFTFKLIENKLS